MQTHSSYSIRFTDHAANLCQQMNDLVRVGYKIDDASRKLGLSKSSGRRYYNGSYDFNPGGGWTPGKPRVAKKSFTCVRRGASVLLPVA